MKMKFLLPFLFALLCSVLISEKVSATSAYPYPVEVTQSDGSVITVIMQGDERLKFAKTLDGYTLVYNAAGIFEYGIQDASGDLVPSGIKANNISQRTLSETGFLLTIPKGLSYSRSQVTIINQLRGQLPSVQAFPTTGNRKLICILVSYADVAMTKTTTDFQNLFNQIGYSADGAAGSVKDFFLECSYNQLNLTVDVVGPYTLDSNRVYYGANDMSGDDVRPKEMVTEAVNLANGDVNYADYDNDNDGSVDAVYVIYAGHGEDAGGGANTIWAHASSIAAVNLDGKSISRYSTSAELRGSSGSGITRIGVVCHEFGHVAGAKDFYDTDYATGGQYNGTGDWDLMATGNWNNSGITPAHPNPYSRAYTYGWATINMLTTQGEVTLQHSAFTANSFYRFNTTTADEFFLLENRQQDGFDANIPGHGLLIYKAHADLTDHFDPNDLNATGPQMFYPVCASANTEAGITPASYGSNNGAGTPYPGTSNQTEFTDETTPSAKSWAGNDTEQPIAFISENVAAGTVSFCYLGCPPVADFSANDTEPCTGETVTFTDLSTYSPESWEWTFAPNTITYTGGTNSTSQNPQVIFNASGLYTVTLKATNEYGDDTEVKSNYINVLAKPTVTLQPVSQAVQWGDTAVFTSTAIGPPAPTVQWQVSEDDGSNWSNISGATSTTLELPCVTLEMDSNLYRAVFTNVCGVTESDPAMLTVTPRVTVGTVSEIPDPQQYSDTTRLFVELANAVACGEQAATSVTFFIGTQEMGTVPLNINGSSLEANLLVTLLEPVPFGTPPTGQMAPGNHAVTAVFNDVNPNFTVTDAVDSLTITPEDARAYYTGACFSSTLNASTSNAVVTLAATIKDITAVAGDPDWDIFAGDIRNATVTFINRDNNTVIAANVPLGLVDPNDATVAVAAYNWNVTIAGNSQTFTIGIIIGGYYDRDAMDDNTIVTVSKPLSDFVTGGGYITLTNSAGNIAGDAGSKSNFGFSVKFNKKGTNLQGTINTMIRRTEADGLHTYQIKGTSFTSLAVQKTSIGGNATINSKANITDVTSGIPVGISGNNILQIKMNDYGDPGTNDSISLTIWDKYGGLIYSSNWNGTRTIQQVIDAGNLKVHTNKSFARLYNDFGEESSLQAFPNPAQGYIMLQYAALENENCTVTIIDMQGRVVLSDRRKSAEGVNTVEYNLQELSSGIYYIRLDSDSLHDVFRIIVSN